MTAMINTRLLVVTLAIFLGVLSSSGMAQKQGEPTPAPLGLKWGMSGKQVAAIGGTLEVEAENGPYGRILTSRALAEQVEGAGLVKLYLGFDDRLWRVVIFSQKYEDDPDARKVMERYAQINEILTVKYGAGHEIKEFNKMRGRSVAWSIARSFTQIGTYYETDGLFVGLEVKASETNITYWMLFYAHKDMTAAVMKKKKAREKSKL